MEESTRRAKRRDVTVIIDVCGVQGEGIRLFLCVEISAVSSVLTFAVRHLFFLFLLFQCYQQVFQIVLYQRRVGFAYRRSPVSSSPRCWRSASRRRRSSRSVAVLIRPPSRAYLFFFCWGHTASTTFVAANNSWAVSVGVVTRCAPLWCDRRVALYRFSATRRKIKGISDYLRPAHGFFRYFGGGCDHQGQRFLHRPPCSPEDRAVRR